MNYFIRLKVAFLLINAIAISAKPQFSIKLQDGTASGFNGLDPTVVWKSETSFGSYDVKFGTDVAVRPTLDLASLPRNFWGMISRDLLGWGVMASADVSAKDLSKTNLNVQASSSELGIGLKLAATAGSKFAVSKIEAIKGLTVPGGKASINPRYSVADSKSDVILTYNRGKTGVQLNASRNAQKLVVSQVVSENSVITPSITNAGEYSVDWLLQLDEGNTVTTTIKPKEYVNIIWKDGPWKTRINAPLSGFSINDVTVNVKRDLIF